jgi:lipoprotein-anchoring transpeptidase ErfK/SrfK
MPTSRASIAAAVATSLCLLWSAPGAAQYYGYPPDYGRPPANDDEYQSPPPQDGYGRRQGYERGPYDQEYEEPRARPRAQRPQEEYEDDPAAAPRRPAPRRRTARAIALPPDADPAYSTPLDLDGDVDFGQTTATVVTDPWRRQDGTITIDTGRRKLYLSIGGGQAVQYGVGVGREGFAWKGLAQIGRKAFWPGWTPPPEMLLRRPDLPKHMEGGIENPLGARALYLFKGPKDTMFRIHGTNEPDTIGQAVSSGCIRMLNADVIDLYRRAHKGAPVVVM